MTTEQIDTAVEEHGFWFQQALDAYEEMMNSVFDLHSEKFDQAKFNWLLARTRARAEYERIEPILTKLAREDHQ